MNIPVFMRLLAESGNVEQARQFAENKHEEIELLRHADQMETARDLARELLYMDEVLEVVPEYDCAYVNTEDFYGHHAIRDERDGGKFPTTQGSYVHEPTGVTFEAECPNRDYLEDAVQNVASTEDPGTAARVQYRRTRL